MSADDAGATSRRIQQCAADVTFDVLVAAADAAAWAVAAAYPEHALRQHRPRHEPPRNPAEAAHRIVVLADRIADAVAFYRMHLELGHDVTHEPLPF